jgi:hypothetical protein
MNLLGNLSWSAIPFDQPIIMGASGGMILGIVSVVEWVTLKGYVPYLWREWLTSVDHKRIGVMYIGNSSALPCPPTGILEGAGTDVTTRFLAPSFFANSALSAPRAIAATSKPM